MAENIRNKQQALLSLMEEMLDKTLHFTDLLDQYHENFKVFKQSFMDWHDQVEQEEEENAVEVEEFVAMSTDVDAQGISLPSVLRNPKPKLISQFSEDQALRQLPDREIIKCETRGVVHRDGDYHRDIPVRIFDPGIHALSHNCRGVVLEGLNLAGLWSKVKTAEEMSLRHLNRLQRLLSKMNEYSSRNILCSKWHEYQEPILFLDDAVERSCSVYHSYIALGSCQLVINEIDNYIATPLQPVKLFALYLSSPDNKESTISSLKEWLADSAIGNNSILRLIGGIICMHEQDYNEAMKHNYLIFIFSSYRNSSARHIEEIDFLVCLPFLRSLWLEGNPLCCVRCYRAQVFRYLFHLDKVKLYDKHISIREYWKRQIIIASRQKRPATLGFYSPAKDVAKEKGGNIKPRGESVKLKKEDSLSSMESDLRSSNFVFMQGAFNATSYEKQTGRSMVYQQCCTFDPPEGVLLFELGTTLDGVRKGMENLLSLLLSWKISMELIWKLLNNCTLTLNLEDKVF